MFVFLPLRDKIFSLEFHGLIFFLKRYNAPPPPPLPEYQMVIQYHVLCLVHPANYYISFSRYYAILHPMKAKYACTLSRARKIVVAIWYLSLILAVPILIGQVRIYSYQLGTMESSYVMADTRINVDSNFL